MGKSRYKPDPQAIPPSERLAAALGWSEIPRLTDEQRRDFDARLAAAQAEARRIYGLDEDAA